MPVDAKPAGIYFYRKLLTRTQVVIRIAGIVPVDLELAAVPVGVRHITITVVRTRLLSGSVRITDNLFQSYLRLTRPSGKFFTKHRLMTNLL